MPAAAPNAPPRRLRRARYLIPRGMPHRAEVVAALSVAVLLAGALFAPLTLLLTVVFAAAGRALRLRPAWLLLPAACGAFWALAAPAAAVAGYAAGPSAVAALLARAATDPAALPRLPAAAGHELGSQFPLALIAAAAVAAAWWWLGWLHTDE